ncbi:MAG: hypothetical protein LBM78_03230, partial [Clostridiales bacterium]|nr:hypothetical protein [Clostridiales bacterium]
MQNLPIISNNTNGSKGPDAARSAAAKRLPAVLITLLLAIACVVIGAVAVERAKAASVAYMYGFSLVVRETGGGNDFILAEDLPIEVGGVTSVQRVLLFAAADADDTAPASVFVSPEGVDINAALYDYSLTYPGLPAPFTFFRTGGTPAGALAPGGGAKGYDMVAADTGSLALNSFELPITAGATTSTTTQEFTLSVHRRADNLLLQQIDVAIGFTNANVTDFFAGGKGTAAEPFIVNTAAHLNNIRRFMHSHFAMGAAVDLAGVAAQPNEFYKDYGAVGTWRSVGYPSATYAFAGVLGGHVKNAQITGGNGFFNMLYGTAFGDIAGSITFENIRSYGADSAYPRALGVVAGYAVNTTFDSIGLNGCLVSSDSALYVGGLAGVGIWTMDADVTNIGADIVVDGGTVATGGLFGSIDVDSLIDNGAFGPCFDFRSCTLSGTVRGTGDVGGLIGSLDVLGFGDSSTYAVIADMRSSVSVFGYCNDNGVGGLVGTAVADGVW